MNAATGNRCFFALSVRYMSGRRSGSFQQMLAWLAALRAKVMG